MSKENTYKTIFQKMFLVEGLPETIKASDSHLQVFDNYVENTRMRLRKIRVPETKSWTRVFEQVYPYTENDVSKLKVSQMFLSDAEYKVLEIFKGREIRKNRYFYEFDDKTFEIDIFLGNLWGLNIAKIYFDTEKDLKEFILPGFVVLDVTGNEFFNGANLVDKTFADVQEKLSQSL